MKKYPDPFSTKDNFARYKDVKSELLWGNPEAVKNPEISIIMPVYSHPTYFRDALKSAVMQDYKGEYEIVVVDNTPLDGCKNENQKIVEEINSTNVLYYRNERNIGMFGNWNRGIELARASHVTYLHDDDMFFDSSVSLLCSFKERIGEKALVAPSWQIEDDGKFEKPLPFQPKYKMWGLLKERYIYEYSLLGMITTLLPMGGGCIFNREVMLKLGGYDEDFYPVGDHGILFKYQKYVGVLCINEFNYLYRIAENESMTAWKKFLTLDIHFWESAKPFIKLPSLVLDRLIEALKHRGEMVLPQFWEGRVDSEKVKAFGICDRVWIKSFEVYQRYRCYRWNFKSK